ncbi:hypothetical protein WG66_008617 [Moniliophthora roreri]|nr:hypothetical protein WG66_008617 [Moniliophthora roreri]
MLANAPSCLDPTAPAVALHFCPNLKILPRVFCTAKRKAGIPPPIPTIRTVIDRGSFQVNTSNGSCSGPWGRRTNRLITSEH